jgi:hypothetical protein
MSFVEKNVKKYRVLFIVVGLLTCCLSGCSVNQPHKKSNKPASVSLNCSKRDARLAADYLHDIASSAVFDQSLTATFVKLGKTDTLKERACIANYIRKRIQPLDPITFNLHLQEMGCYFVDLQGAPYIEKLTQFVQKNPWYMSKLKRALRSGLMEWANDPTDPRLATPITAEEKVSGFLMDGSRDYSKLSMKDFNQSLTPTEREKISKLSDDLLTLELEHEQQHNHKLKKPDANVLGNLITKKIQPQLIKIFTQSELKCRQNA